MKLKLSGIYCVAVALLILLGEGIPARAQTYSLLYSFTGSNWNGDGRNPENAGLIKDSAGNLYGTTSGGGDNGCGTVYELSPPSTPGGSWTETVLYSFAPPSNPNDGCGPEAGLVMDSNGNLYGTTSGGGNFAWINQQAEYLGTVFMLARQAGGAWSEGVIYAFTGGSDGWYPQGGLALREVTGDIQLFGTTINGGDNTYGTLFEVELSGVTPGVICGGSCGITLKTLHAFGAFAGDGTYAEQQGSLVFDTSGDLFGTTNGGGANSSGSVFEWATSPGSYAVIYSFGATANDGVDPYADLAIDSAGNLFGTTQSGGGFDYGTVFKLSPPSTPGGDWTETPLYSFGGYSNDAKRPQAPVVIDASGNLYGVAYGGYTGIINGYAMCDQGCGTVFELVKSSDGYTEKVLHYFAVSSGDGVLPQGNLVLDSTGNLYGTTEFGGANGGEGDGTVFEISSGSAPAVSLSASNLDFGNQQKGITSAEKSVTVTNSGTANLTLAAGAVTLSGTNSADFAISTDTCSGQTVAANATCTAGVTFTPSVATSESASLNFTDNATGSPQTVSLTGTGVLPTVTVTPGSLTFASQVVGTTSAAQTVMLSNTGTVALTITSLSTSLADFPQESNCGTSLAANSDCTIYVGFKPSTTGTIAGTLTIDDNVPGSPQQVTLSGTGTAPTVTVLPSSLNFSGEMKGSTTAAKTVTLSNTSGAAVSITSIAATGDFAEANTCGTSVAANGSCTINVTFKPTTSGARSGTLSITDNATGSPQTVALAGTGEDFSLTDTTSAQSVARGGTATFALQVVPLGGLTDTVTLACSGAPAKSVCTVIPASVTLNGTASASATVTISTTASSVTLPLAPNPPAWPLGLFWITIASMALLPALARLAPKRAKTRFVMLAPLAVLLFVVAFSASCGAGGNTGTPTGTFPLTITGTCESMTNTATLSLTVH